MQTSLFFWIIFFVFISGAVIYDLWILGRKKKDISLKEAGLWTLAWVLLALFFNLLIYLFLGSEEALQFLTAYLLEKSLSLDNLFVFLIIFSYFDLPMFLQRKVLSWGILGAFFMRAIFIFGGLWLLGTFHFLFYLFGAFLIFTGIRLVFQKSEKVDPQKNLFLRIVKKIIPLTDEMQEGKFCLRKENVFCFTPLFVILLLIESSDVVFALDSVPAVLSITQSPFIAYTSNAFAILGLRALYFFLAGFLPKFIYLKKGVIALLIFIGFKMLFSDIYQIPLIFSLAVIFLVLTLSILLSLIKKKKENHVIAQ
jgi:tellurite resistance protein TerC